MSGQTRQVLHWLSLLLFCLSSCQGESLSEGQTPSRQARLFPIFEVVRFANTGCDASGSRNGTCFTSSECEDRGGVSSGTCASGFGVCCVFTLSCGGVVSENSTFLVQAGTATLPADGVCTYRICKCSSDICRIRLDFNTFSIAGPAEGTTDDATAIVSNGAGIGDCITDSFAVTSGSGSGSPIICGFNTGQHMFIDASDACSLATFSLGSTMFSREWDIMVTQYRCGDELGGPSGCLQYFTGTTGVVSSFNFPTTQAAVGAQTTHLSNQCYTMCFRQEADRCAICFTPAVDPTVVNANTQTSFGLSVSNDAAVAKQQADAACTTDYLLVPDAELITLTLGTPSPVLQKVCGRYFRDTNDVNSNTLCSQSVPFQITFKTDGNELTDVANDATVNEQFLAPSGTIGFSLQFDQVQCTP